MSRALVSASCALGWGGRPWELRVASFVYDGNMHSSIDLDLEC